MTARTTCSRRLLKGAFVVVVLVLAAGLAEVGAPGAMRPSALVTRLAELRAERAADARPPDEKYPPASECGRCHPTQEVQWRGSAHARSASDPLVHASICGRCHAPLGTQLDPEYQLKLVDRSAMTGLPEAAAEGVTCVTCHSPTHTPESQVFALSAEWPNWRVADLALVTLPFDRALGSFGRGGEADPLPVANDSHDSVADAAVLGSESCRPCHEAIMDKAPLSPHCGLGQSRVLLLTTYSEWADSSYARDGQTCQSCHMPRAQALGVAAMAPSGTSYDRELPARPLADHTVTGVSAEYLKSGPEVVLQQERVAARVRSAASIALAATRSTTLGSSLDITATITNTGAGHDLPTGFAYWSEAWLEVLATDSTGRRVFASGDTDDAGWLRDEFNPRVIEGSLAYDAYLVSLRARLVTVGPNRDRWLEADGTIRIPPDEVPRNLNGTPIIGLDHDVSTAIALRAMPQATLPGGGEALREGYILRFADTVLRNGIPARRARTFAFRASLDGDVKGPVRVSARLLIRSLWPWMLLQQEELPSPRPLPRTYEVASASQRVGIGPP